MLDVVINFQMIIKLISFNLTDIKHQSKFFYICVSIQKQKCGWYHVLRLSISVYFCLIFWHITFLSSIRFSEFSGVKLLFSRISFPCIVINESQLYTVTFTSAISKQVHTVVVSCMISSASTPSLLGSRIPVKRQRIMLRITVYEVHENYY